jgi:hypothetical protein
MKIMNKAEISHDMQKIIEHIFDVDIRKTFERLQENLHIGSDRSDYGSVLVHLDYAETNARDAHRLYLTGKIERERYEHDYAPIKAEMWDRAVARLQAEKQSGSRSKQITSEDVHACVMQHDPDEYRAHELRLKKLKGAEEHLKELAELWKLRCRTLQTILATIRK